MSSRLGEYIQTLRYGKGLTIRGLGSTIGWNNSSITKLEQGQRVPSLDRLWRIVKELDGDFGQAIFLLCLDSGVPEEDARKATSRLSDNKT